MGDLGLFGLGGPEEYGGAGDFTSLCIAIEEIGKVDQSLGITLEAAVGLGINPLAHFGTAAQQARWLPDLLAGRALAAFGLTESEAGSDAGATRTRATLHDHEWVINGSKEFITNSGTDITSSARSRPVPAPGTTASPRSPRSSCPPALLVSWSVPATRNLAGTPPILIR